MDGTLLSLDVGVFIPAYIKSLAVSIKQASPQLLVPSLVEASRQMVLKSQPIGTLESTFDRQFYPAIGLSKDQLQQAIEEFYENTYSSLKSYSIPRPEMVKTIEWLLKSGYQIVVATNPLFPATAISQRLDWAGLKEVKTQFSIITSFENFHFAKPHPHYYAEILAQLGWPDQPAVMIEIGRAHV